MPRLHTLVANYILHNKYTLIFLSVLLRGFFFHTAWPQWDEVIQLAELSQCRNKSVWFKLYDEEHLIGQLYLDATEIDVDNVVRWYELEPGFMIHENGSVNNR